MSEQKNHFDEIFEILSDLDSKSDSSKPLDSTQSANAPDESASMTEPTTEDAECFEGEMPASIFSHLSEDGESVRQEPDISNPHFTDAVDDITEETPYDNDPVPETEEDDGDEEEVKEKRSKRLIFGIFDGLSVFAKALVYISIVVIMAGYLSYFIISVGNDVFALVAPDREIEVVIPEDATDDQVAAILEENGIIEHAWVFKIYMQYRSDGEATQYIPGTYILNANENYTQLITALTTVYKERVEVRITIPEGFTVDQIIDLFVENGIGTKEGYVQAINEHPYKHEFVVLLEEMGYSEDRKYRLEGYLFPDTYDFYTDTSEVYVINKLLNNFNDKFWKEFTKKNSEGVSYSEYCLEEYGMTFDDIIVLSSMVQAEGKTAVDFEYISYVFHNRLSHPGSFPRLESDATIQYVLPERISDSTELDISFDSPYNTYLYDGLPPGGVANAGIDALLAAMFPSPPLDSDGDEINAYYFVSNNAGKTYYASSLSSHQRNVAKVKQENEAMETGDYE